MTLSELRRLSIRKQYRIRFRLRNGMECVVTERGIAEVPGIQGIPDFNLEEELASAGEFLLDPATAPKDKGGERPRAVRRAELARMLESTPSAAAAATHDED